MTPVLTEAEREDVKRFCRGCSFDNGYPLVYALVERLASAAVERERARATGTPVSIGAHTLRVAGFGFQVMTDFSLPPSVIRIQNADGRAAVEYNADTKTFHNFGEATE